MHHLIPATTPRLLAVAAVAFSAFATPSFGSSRTLTPPTPLLAEPALAPAVDVPVDQALEGWSAWEGGPAATLTLEEVALFEQASFADETWWTQQFQAIELGLLADRNVPKAVHRFELLWTLAFHAFNQSTWLDTDVALQIQSLRYNLAAATGAFEVLEGKPRFAPSREVIEQFAELDRFVHLLPYTELKNGETAEAFVARVEATPSVQNMRQRVADAAAAMQGIEDEIDAYVANLFGGVGDELRKSALDMLRTGQSNDLRNLGRPALAALAEPVLRSAVREEGQLLASDVENLRLSIDFMVREDQAGALRLVCDWLPRAKDDWRSAVTKTMVDRLEPQFAMSSSDVWPLLVDPNFARFAELAVADPALASLVLGERGGLVEVLASQNQLTSGLVEALGDRLAGPDRVAAGGVLETLAVDYRVPSVVPVLERGFHESPFLDVRRQCARNLFGMGEVMLLRAQARSADDVLAELGARSMGQVSYRVRSEGRGTAWDHVQLPITADDVATIGALLASDVREVREAMENSLGVLTFPPSVLDALLTSPNATLRANGLRQLTQRPLDEQRAKVAELLAEGSVERRRELLPKRTNGGWTPGWDMAMYTTILKSLAQDPEASLRGAVDMELVDRDSYLFFRQRQDRIRTVAEVLPVRADDTCPLAVVNGSGDWLDFASLHDLEYQHTPSLLAYAHSIDAPGLGAWLVESAFTEGVSDVEAIGLLYELPVETRIWIYELELDADAVGRMSWRWETFEDLRRDMSFARWVDAEAVQLHFARAGVTSDWVRLALTADRPTLDGLRLAVLGDPAADLVLRAEVGKRLGNDPRAVSAIPGLWVAASEAIGRERADATGHLAGWIRELPDAASVFTQLDFDLVPAHEGLAFVERVSSSRSEPPAAWVLETFGRADVGGEEGASLVRNALGRLRGMALDEATRNALVAVAQSPRYQREALQAMATWPDDRFAEVALWSLNNGGSRVAPAALEVLVGAPTVERIAAVEAWLVTAPSTMETSGRATIERMRARLAPPSVLPTEAEAVADLIERLASGKPAVRRIAALGLARFGALEALPILLDALEAEEDASVSAALEAAIEELLALERE